MQKYLGIKALLHWPSLKYVKDKQLGNANRLYGIQVAENKSDHADYVFDQIMISTFTQKIAENYSIQVY